jgi:hypothetical protein
VNPGFRCRSIQATLTGFVAIDAIEERNEVGLLLRTGRLLIIGFVLTGLAGRAVATSACVSIFACENPNRPLARPVADAGSSKNAAAARVEQLYNGVPAGTDAENNEGYNAAQNAEHQLRLDFLGSFQNPQKNAANQTAWDEKEAQLISHSLKYGGDRTLDAAAMYWGETHLNLPVLSPQELLAQAKDNAGRGSAGRKRVCRVHGQLSGQSLRLVQQAGLLLSFGDRRYRGA